MLRTKSLRRAFTFGEVVITIMVSLVLLTIACAIFLPAIGNGGPAYVALSMNNLRNFGAAHATYASEWNGRQWTTTPDNMDSILNDSDGYQAIYSDDPANPESRIPSVLLGFDRDGVMHSSRKGWAIQPLFYVDNAALGNFRAFHTQPFNTYINAKVYDPIFWAPKDYSITEKEYKWMDDPGEWPADCNTLAFSSYSTSPAGQFNPEVLSSERGRVADPKTIINGFQTPNLNQASYPDLKTHMLEHYWLQNNPSEHIPDTDVPWFFNMGLDSTPATLFYDSSVRMMSVKETVDSNKRVIGQGKAPLWLRDVPYFGSNGYFENYSYDGEEVSSYHIFTADGIKGRDSIDTY